MNSSQTLTHPQKHNILVIDYNSANVLVLKTILEELDLNLVQVSSGEEAMSWLQCQDCAVAFLVVQKPGLNGFETAKRMREQCSHLPIIFAS